MVIPTLTLISTLGYWMQQLNINRFRQIYCSSSLTQEWVYPLVYMVFFIYIYILSNFFTLLLLFFFFFKTWLNHSLLFSAQFLSIIHYTNLIQLMSDKQGWVDLWFFIQKFVSLFVYFGPCILLVEGKGLCILFCIALKL